MSYSGVFALLGDRIAARVGADDFAGGGGAARVGDVFAGAGLGAELDAAGLASRGAGAAAIGFARSVRGLRGPRGPMTIVSNNRIARSAGAVATSAQSGVAAIVGCQASSHGCANTSLSHPAA